MASAKARARDLEQQAEEFLSGRAPVTARELIELIREINPTGRELPKRVEQRRYALKSRLQSLLIARFGEELSLEQDGPDANVVLLRHRYLDAHACHAAIDQLEPDARAWVRLRLDLGEAAPARVSAHAPKQRRAKRVEAEDPVAQGDRALEEYDFDAAREAYLAGLDEPSYSVRAARALLAMLVDQLAADDEALALESELPNEALAEPSVVELLAVAAARGGQPETAHRLLRTLETPRAAEPLTLLAREAIRSGDLDEADRLLARARERDPLFPELIGAAEELQKARADARKPLEDEAEAAWERGAHDEAERLARRILEQWPDSAPARRIVRKREESRRDERIRALLDEANSAEREGRFEEAAARLRVAAAQGASGLEQRIAEVDARARAFREEAEIARACDLLDGADREASLVQFLALPVAIREGAAKLRPARSIGWALAMHGAGVAELQAARAALALERVIDEGSHSEAAWEALEPHFSALERIPEGRRTIDALRRWRTEQRQRESETLLDAAEERFARGELDDAMEAFDGVSLEALEPERRDAAQELRERIGKARQNRDALEESARAEADGDLFGALEIVRSLASDEPALLQRERELRARLSRDFRLRVENVGVEAARLVSRCDAGEWEDPGCWLSPEGLLYLARCEGRRLFVTEVDVQSRRALRQATLVTPGSLSHAEHWVDERSLWFANQGAILQLDRATFEPLRWKTTDELVAPGEEVEVVLPVPGSDFVWVCSRVGLRPQRGAVWEAGRWRVVRRVDEQPGAKTLVLGDPPEVLMSGWASTSMLAGARGTPVTALACVREWRVHSAAWHPTHPGLVVLLKLTDDMGVDPKCLAALEPPHGLRTVPVEFEGSTVEGIAGLAVSPAAMMAFVLFDSEAGRMLHAYRFDDGRPVEAWRTFVSDDTCLAQDAAGERAVLLSSVDGELLLRELGPEPVALERAQLDRRPPAIDAPFICSIRNPETTRVQEAGSRLLKMPKNVRADFIARKREESMGNPDELYQIMEFAHYAGEDEERVKTLEIGLKRHPSDPWLATRWAEELLLAPETRAEARGVLERLALETIPSRLVRHYLHLLGAARLHAGDSAGAAEAWTRGLEHPGRCGLESCLALVDDELRPSSGANVGRTSLWVAALNALRRADECLERGDAASALGALEASGARVLEAVEIHARFASAWLQLESVEPERRFEKALALAMFVRLIDEQPGETSDRSGARPKWRSWGQEKLAELASRAREWLEGADA